MDVEEQLKTAIAELSKQFGSEFSTPSLPLSGCNNWVYLINHNGEAWALRIPKDEMSALIGRRGTAMLRHLNKMRPDLQVPRLIHESETDQYTAMQYLPGETIDSWDSSRLSDERRHQLLDSLAAFFFELWTCPVAETAPSIEYRDWLRDEIDKGFLRSLNQGSQWGDPVSFLHRRAIMDDIIPSYNGSGSAVKHGDLNILNFLMDEQGISGVVDWDFSQFVPLPAAVHHPYFIADIPGFITGAPEGMAFKQDREYLENAMSKLAAKSRHPQAQQISQLLSSCSERQFFEMALRNKKINEQHIRLRVQDSSRVNTAMLLGQLDAFLALNLSLQDDARISALRVRLSGPEQGSTEESSSRLAN